MCMLILTTSMATNNTNSTTSLCNTVVATQIFTSGTGGSLNTAEICWTHLSSGQQHDSKSGVGENISPILASLYWLPPKIQN